MEVTDIKVVILYSTVSNDLSMCNKKKNRYQGDLMGTKCKYVKFYSLYNNYRSA